MGFTRLAVLSFRTNGGDEGGEGVGEEACGGSIFLVVVGRGGAMDGVSFPEVITVNQTDEHFNASFHAWTRCIVSA